MTTDDEFKQLLKKYLTIRCEVKNNFNNPYLRIELAIRAGGHFYADDEPIAFIEIDGRELLPKE